jgi:hypothetical protein
MAPKDPVSCTCKSIKARKRKGKKHKRIINRPYTRSANGFKQGDKGRNLRKLLLCADNSEKNISTTRRTARSGQLKENILINSSSTSSTTSATAASHARGLAVTYSRKLSMTLGGSTSPRPECEKLPSRPAISSTSATR